MVQVLAVIQVLLAMGLIALILMHSGRDAGLGGMGFTPASQGGTHIVERNLTRLTVVIGILFVSELHPAVSRAEVAALCAAVALVAAGCGSNQAAPVSAACCDGTARMSCGSR